MYCPSCGNLVQLKSLYDPPTGDHRDVFLGQCGNCADMFKVKADATGRREITVIPKDKGNRNG